MTPHPAPKPPARLGRVLRARGWALCRVGVIYQVALYFVVAPLTAGAWSFAVGRASGSSAVVNSGLTDLATSPLSLLALAAAALLAVATDRVAAAASAATVITRRASAWDALVDAAKNVGELIKIALWQFWTMFVYAAPALAAAAVAYVIAFGLRGPVAAYARNQQAMFLIGGVLGGVLVVVWSYLALRWLFAVPSFVGEGYRGRAALRRSHELTAGRWARMGGAIVGLVIVLLVVVGLGSALSREAVLRASASTLWLAVWLAANFVVGIALTVFTFVVLQAYVLSRYLAARDLPIPGASTEHVGRSVWVGLGAIAVGAVGIGLIGMLVGAVLLARPVAPSDIELIAHRAGEAHAPENTVAAVRQARKDKADRLEFDVQRTSDGVLVVVHDSDLLRLSGKDVSVGGSTLAQLQAVDIGKGEHVPTLNAFLDAAGDTPLALEIKTHAGDRESTKEVVAMLQKRGAIGRTVLLSLDPGITQLAHDLDPKLRTADLVSVAVGEVPLLPADVIAPMSTMASAVFVATAHSAGKEVWVWSVEDDAMVREAAIRGVDGIITSDVPGTRKTLAQMGALSPEEVRRQRIDDLLTALEN